MRSTHLPLLCLRTGHRALAKVDSGGDGKTWILSGNLFVKTRNETAKILISRGEHWKTGGNLNERVRRGETQQAKHMHKGIGFSREDQGEKGKDM